MAIKVKIARLVTAEVELPEKCPHCEADFSEPGALVEADWVPMEFSAKIEKGEVECDVDSREEAESNFDVAYFRCRECARWFTE